ncbi:MAG: hypothetical protein U5N85_13225 [Arcicella sp.]|nr:hypothetical protein [Arcicella sp.]
MNKVIDVEIKIFQVFCGDCISIVYTDEVANSKSIIIDAGFSCSAPLRRNRFEVEIWIFVNKLLWGHVTQ